MFLEIAAAAFVGGAVLQVAREVHRRARELAERNAQPSVEMRLRLVVEDDGEPEYVSPVDRERQAIEAMRHALREHNYRIPVPGLPFVDIEPATYRDPPRCPHCNQPTPGADDES